MVKWLIVQETTKGRPAAILWVIARRSIDAGVAGAVNLSETSTILARSDVGIAARAIGVMGEHWAIGGLGS